MATIGVLIARVEARLALASGLDVQIVDEPRFLEMLRSTYNTLFDETWWPSTMTLGTYQLDGVSGLIVGDVTGLINRIEDIRYIFYNDTSSPIAPIKWGFNPRQNRRPGWAPYTIDPTKMFKIYPIDQDAEINIWFRTRLLDSQWEEDNDETEVNIDDEMLILGTVYEYLSDDGSNETSANKYKAAFEKRKRQILAEQFTTGIAKMGDSEKYPTSWQDNG